MSAKMRFFAAGLIALGVTACATHPLPEDVTGENTVRIVHKIRCEAKDALDEITGEYLINHAMNEDTRIIGNQFKTHQLSGDTFWGNKAYYLPLISLKPEGKLLFQTFTQSAVTFDFKLTMLEQNSGNLSATFGVPLANGALSLPLNAGANAGADLRRQNERKFMVSDTFFNLHNIPREECQGLSAKIGNVFYPIVGQIGLWEVFHTFIEISSLSNPDPTVTKAANPAPPTEHAFTDRLTFTTNLGGDIGPTFTANSAEGRVFRLASASASLAAKRNDEHEVSIALARGTFTKSFATLRAGGSILVDPRSAIATASRETARARSRELAQQLRFETFVSGIQRFNQIQRGIP